MSAGEKRLDGSSATVVFSELSKSNPLWVEPTPVGITSEASGFSLAIVSPSVPASSISGSSRCPSTTSFKAMEVGENVCVVADALID